MAPAKLNLFLETPERRPDGYHAIDTVMVAIDCVDEVSVSIRRGSGIELRCVWTDDDAGTGKILTASPSSVLPASDENLAYAAALAMAAAFRRDDHIAIEIAKRIPAGAGMGGASSDAAAVLNALVALWKIDDSPRVHAIAADLGSDVPFFLADLGHTAAVATGRGEHLRPFTMARPIHVVVAHPGISLSTAAVYAANRIDPPIRRSDAMVNALACGGMFDAADGGESDGLDIHPYNRLTEPAQKLCPAVEDLLRHMRTIEPDAAVGMTGSGSACFAICQSGKMAARLADRLKTGGDPHWWIGQFESIVDPVGVVIR